VRVFVDTNVLVYLFDADAPDKQQRARDVVADLAQRKALVLSAQVLGELYVTLTRKLAEPLPADQALRVIADLAVYPVVALDATLVRQAAELSMRDQLAYWDALILTAAAEAGADTVYSEDFQSGRSYRGVTVVDPFVASR
jgi:predicted nucleic acid-binding protein